MIITTCNACERIVDNSSDERQFYMYETIDNEEYCLDCYEEIFINQEANENE